MVSFPIFLERSGSRASEFLLFKASTCRCWNVISYFHVPGEKRHKSLSFNVFSFLGFLWRRWIHLSFVSKPKHAATQTGCCRFTRGKGHYSVKLEVGVNRKSTDNRTLNASKISLLFGIRMNRVRAALQFECEDWQPQHFHQWPWT